MHLSKATIVIAVIIAVLCDLSGDVVLTMKRFGNQFSYFGSPIFVIALALTSVLATPLIILQYKWWRGAEQLRYQKLAKIFIVSALLSSAIGFVTDLIVPIFTTATVTPLGSITTLMASMTTYILMFARKTQRINVRNVSGFTFSSIMMPILVLDRKNNVGLENKATTDFLGVNITGENIASYILYEEKPVDQSFFNDSFDSEVVTIETPSGTRICEMRLTVERDKLGDTIFKVVILRDLTERFHMTQQLDTALTDELTGARNRRYFVEKATEQLNSCIEKGQRYSLIIIDADHFKNVNDTYGHHVGDEVLRILVARTRNTLKQDTLLARIGGEEFVVSLPDTSHENVMSTAERIRAGIESNAFKTDDHQIKVTISIGVASLSDEAKTLSDILRNSDKALYKAKQTGRNKVIYYEVISIPS